MLDSTEIADIIHKENPPPELLPKIRERLTEWAPLLVKLPDEKWADTIRLLVQIVITEDQVLKEASCA